LFAFLIVAAIVAIEARDLLTAVSHAHRSSRSSRRSSRSVMGAVDVGFTEAVVGAGITGVLFVVAVYHTERDSAD
jgi:energy-converting hydrogenase B subunit D